jgi:hypothetical protein
MLVDKKSFLWLGFFFLTLFVEYFDTLDDKVPTIFFFFCTIFHILLEGNMTFSKYERLNGAFS